MIELLSIKAKGVPVFDSLNVRLSSSLTYVRGINQDAGERAAPSNGVGKTLIWSLPANVVYGAATNSLKKKAKKELLGKSSSITLELRSGEHHYEVTQTASKYVIAKDGVDQEVRTTPLAEAMIRRIWPMTDLGFYTYCFVSTQKTYPFQYDTDANRLSALVELFELDKFEPLRKLFSEQLSAVKTSGTKAEVLKDQLRLAKTRLAETSYDEAEHQSVRLSLRNTAEKARAADRRIFDLGKSVEELKTLVDLERELDAARKAWPYPGRSPKKMVVQLKALRKLVRAWHEYDVELRTYKKSRARLEQELEALAAPEHSQEQLDQGIAAAESKLSKLKSDVAAQTEARSRYKKLVEQIKELARKVPENFVPPSDLEERIGHARTTMSLKDLAETAANNRCPTCHQEVDIKAVRKLIQKASAEYAELRELQRTAQFAAQLKEVKRERRAVEYSPEALEEAKAKEAAVSKELKALQKEQCVLEERAALSRRIKKLERPEPPAEDRPELSEQQLTEHLDLCSTILTLLGRKEALAHHETTSEKAAAKRLKYVKAELEEAEAEAAKLRSKEARLSKENERLTSAATMVEQAQADVETLRRSVKRHKVDPNERLALEALVKAYGARGLRTAMAAEICSLIETNLNYYRDLVFFEPFKFTMSAGDSGLSIRVDRGNGLESDVRSLSGAESNSFRLLFVLSVLPLIPDSKRVNFIVLDECTAHMSVENRQLITERYLPVLREAVPHVFVVTNHNDEYSSDSDTWLITKKKGRSTLLDGSVKASIK